jgi:Flp pilus assembly protein TadG
MVLLETALAIPLLAMVAVCMAWGLSLAATSLSLGDAARAAARDIARGEPSDEAVARAISSIPGARAHVEVGGDAAAVVVTDEVRAPVPLLAGLPVTITQRVAIPREWT